MEKVKIISIDSDSIVFSNGITLYSYHNQDCCESHYLYFDDIIIEDVKDLEFDIDSDNFVEKVEDYGIKLNPLNGFGINIPGYGYNNGYYSTDLQLIFADNNHKIVKSIDISECQTIQS